MDGLSHQEPPWGPWRKPSSAELHVYVSHRRPFHTLALALISIGIWISGSVGTPNTTLAPAHHHLQLSLSSFPTPCSFLWLLDAQELGNPSFGLSLCHFSPGCILPPSEWFIGMSHKPSTQWQHRVNVI